MSGGRKRHYESKMVADHLRGHLGLAFSSIVEEVAENVEIGLHGFADKPFEGQVCLVTEGLAAFYRAQKLADRDGLAQEVALVVDSQYFGEAMLEFFLAAVSVHAQQGRLLRWDEPIRLTSAVPGGRNLRFLLPMPAAIFDESFQFVEEPSGSTNICLLVPVHESEAEFVLADGPERLYEQFEEFDVDISDLNRPPVVATG